MNELLLRLAVALPSESTPPVQCGLLDKVKAGFGSLVGNVLGLQDLVPWIIAVLVAAAVLVAVIPKLRRAVINNLLAVIAIAVAGGVVLGAVALFLPAQCG